MSILAKIFAKIVANIFGLWLATTYVVGFVLTGGAVSFIIGGAVLAGVNIIIRPILKFITLPFLILTLGAFYIVIFIVLLLIADMFLPQLTITGFMALFWGALIIGVINTLVH